MKSNEKEIINQCSWCKDYVQDGKPVNDVEKLWEIEDKLEQDIAILSHGICKKCLIEAFPDYCHED